MNKSRRQGDVLIIECAEVLGKELPNETNKTILALGEVTGHHHRFEDKVKHFLHDDRGGRDFFTPPATALLKHEEHDHFLPPGEKIEQLYQFEYTPKELRRAQD